MAIGAGVNRSFWGIFLGCGKKWRAERRGGSPPVKRSRPNQAGSGRGVSELVLVHFFGGAAVGDFFGIPGATETLSGEGDGG